MPVMIKETRRGRKILLTVIRDKGGSIKKGIRHGLFEIGKENQKHCRKLIADKKKTGRIYMISGTPHQASAPGEAPASISGTLLNGIDYIIRGSKQLFFGGKAPYDIYLELGTRNMEPRPHLITTINTRGEENKMIFARSVDKEIKRNAA